MPMRATSTGFDITFARGRCLLFALVALPFSVLMLLAGINGIFPLLDDTLLHWLIIQRNPVLLYSALAVIGSLVFGYILFWNASRVVGDGLAIRVDSSGIVSRSIIGKREIQWTDVSHVSLQRSTIFLHPNPESGQRPVPLSVALTGVSPDELQSGLRRYRPDLFNESYNRIWCMSGG